MPNSTREGHTVVVFPAIDVNSRLKPPWRFGLELSALIKNNSVNIEVGLIVIGFRCSILDAFISILSSSSPPQGSTKLSGISPSNGCKRP